MLPGRHTLCLSLAAAADSKPSPASCVLNLVAPSCTLCAPAPLLPGGRAFIVYPLRSALSAAEEKRLGGMEAEVGEGDLRSATAEFGRLQKQKVFGTDK